MPHNPTQRIKPTTREGIRILYYLDEHLTVPKLHLGERSLSSYYIDYTTEQPKTKHLPCRNNRIIFRKPRQRKNYELTYTPKFTETHVTNAEVSPTCSNLHGQTAQYLN